MHHGGIFFYSFFVFLLTFNDDLDNGYHHYSYHHSYIQFTIKIYFMSIYQKKRIEHNFWQYYHKKRVGFRSVNVSTFIYGFTKYWIELCSKTLSVVQEERIFWPHWAIRWHPLTILSTDTILAFLWVWHVEHVTEWSPVLGLHAPSWVNHST